MSISHSKNHPTLVGTNVVYFLISKGTFNPSFILFYKNEICGPVLKPVLWIFTLLNFNHFQKEFRASPILTLVPYSLHTIKPFFFWGGVRLVYSTSVDNSK